MSDWVGQTVGRYYLIEALGQGGMATVYRAYDTRLRREVAVKFIRRDLVQQTGSDESILKRFEREAISLGKLSHPNIVAVHDYGEHERAPYLVMEYVEGGTLKKLLGQPIACADAARLLAPVARALEYAHQHKLVHRDVKPANILLTDLGAPKLSDFGIARIVESGEATLTSPGVGIGTPEYMAPEQALSGKVDQRADIYSLGVVFFEMITGKKPFQADTPMAVMLKHLHDPLPRPSSLATGISGDAERIVFQSMAKQPEDRYQEMGAFARDLERLALASLGGAEADKSTLHQQSSPLAASAAQPRPNQPPSYQAAPPIAAPVQAPQTSHTTPSGVPADAAPPKKRSAWLAPVLVIGGLGFVLCLAVAAVLALKPGGLGRLLGMAPSVTATRSPSHTPRPTRTATDVPIPTAAPTLAPTLVPTAPGHVLTATATPSGPMEYVIQEGDTCMGIANMFGVSVDLIVAMNGLPADCGVLTPGQFIFIPAPGQSLPTPTLVPGSTEGRRLDFADDFSSPASGWEKYSGPEGSRGYGNGSYFIEDLSGSIWAFAPGVYADARIEVDCEQVEGSDPSAGIFCRYNGDVGADAYMAVIYDDGTFSIQKFVDNENIVMLDWSVAPSYHPGLVNRLRFDCEGVQISFSVNGEVAGSVTDISLSSGFTGFALFRNSGASALANFDNYAIYVP